MIEMLEQNTMRLMIALAGIIVLGTVIYFMTPYMGDIQGIIKEAFNNKPNKF